MKRIFIITLSSILILGILLIPQSTTTAQSPNPTPPANNSPIGAASGVTTVLNPSLDAPDMASLQRGENVTFRYLQAIDSTMIGPFDSYYLNVGIPSTWKLTEKAMLTLKIDLDVNIPPEAEKVYRNWLGPRLDIYFDDIYITSLRISKNGEHSFDIPLPIYQMQPVRAGNHFLYMYLDAAYDCEFDQSTVLTVKSDSFFSLPHTPQEVGANLNSLPMPFFQLSSILPNQVTLVVPDTPTEKELEAALIVAAGFGRMTANSLQLGVVTASQLTEPIRKNSHLIYVGKGGSIPALASMGLPANVVGGQFKAYGAQTDDGIIQIAPSQGNPEKAILVVGGNSDLGLKKAAQAISTGVVRALYDPQLVVVSEVVPKNAVLQGNFAVDRSFGDLGYQNITLSGIGAARTEYFFTLPGGYKVSEDAYLDLAYTNSGLLDFDRSSVSVILNGTQVNSVSYTSEMRKEKSEPIRFPLPDYAFIPGVNTLVVEATHEVVYCTYYTSTDIWTTIFNKSRLHLPQSTEAVLTSAVPNLSNYPKPLADDPELASTAFIISRGNPAALFTAAKIAEDLGRQSTSNIIDLKAVYQDNATEDIKKEYNLILVGKPSEQPILFDLRNSLPAPFPEGSNIADESGLSVSYRLAPEASVGYMQYLDSPWNTNKVILAALGTTPEGLEWTAKALTDPLFTTQLTGNYAVTNGVTVYGVDTDTGSGTRNIGVTASPSMAITLSPASQAVVDAIPTAIADKKTTLFDVDPSLWVPYAITIFSILTVLVLVIIVAVYLKKKRDENFRIRDR